MVKGFFWTQIVSFRSFYWRDRSFYERGRPFILFYSIKKISSKVNNKYAIFKLRMK